MQMRRSITCAVRRLLAAGLCGAWLAAAATAQATAIGGTPQPVRGTLGPVQPAQAQQAPNVESSIAMLHQRLGITPAQEPAFNAFANVVRENARTQTGGPPPANANAVYALQQAIRYGEQEIDGMRRMLPALQGLYATLSPQQQAVANQLFRQGPGR
jgi:periplasmic protein CpxP/Spy